MTLFNPGLQLPARTQAAANRRDALINQLTQRGFTITAKSPIHPTLNIVTKVSLVNTAEHESASILIEESTPGSFPLTVQLTIASYATY